MTASRTRRFVGGLSLGFLHTAIVTIVGLWLTPYLLRHLDQHDYGLWLLTLQMLFYLALTDVGIVALLPREIALRDRACRRDVGRRACDTWSVKRHGSSAGRRHSSRSWASSRGGSCRRNGPRSAARSPSWP